MSKNLIAAYALLVACPCLSLAQQVVAINDYLKPIVSEIAADPNSGSWTWEINRNGGYLLRKSMDVTGDGQPELFVASTLQSTRHEEIWTVFDVAQDGTLRPYRTTLEHSSAWPIVEGDNTYLVYVMPPNKERLRDSDEKPYPVDRFAFAFPEITMSSSYVSEAEATKLRPSDPSLLPKLQAILLADYLTNPDAKWKDVAEWKQDANDCFFRSEDKERAAKNTAFTPQAALSHLGIVQKGDHPYGLPPKPHTASAKSESEKEPIPHANNALLDKIPHIRLAQLSEPEITSIYVSRMSIISKYLSWVSYVDNDILSRPNSVKILLKILTTPSRGSVQGGLWQWLIDHPDYVGGPLLLDESIKLFNSEGIHWDAITVSTLAQFIATIGNADQIRILDAMQELGGMGVDMARQRYQNRMQKSLISPPFKKNSAERSLLPQKQKNKEPDRLPEAKREFYALLFKGAVVIVALAVSAWILIKKRRRLI